MNFAMPSRKDVRKRKEQGGKGERRGLEKGKKEGKK